MESLFEKISVKRLAPEVVRLVSLQRAGVSRNTVTLALQDERHEEERTPLRNYIRQVAERLLEEQMKGQAA